MLDELEGLEGLDGLDLDGMMDELEEYFGGTVPEGPTPPTSPAPAPGSESPSTTVTA
jgi:hypothetical protein